ncbi:MAG: tRNA lysidine(34) synthetase TilS, partial [Armatimonadetes bacterium]|nr:tRNA lysidine(34) synthetase TilS [Armatimonadota bacterium]
TIPGVTETPGGRLTAESTDMRGVPSDPHTAILANGGEPWSVRNRRNGDRIRPIGLDGSRKVADILTDRKVPLSVRDSLPLVLCGLRIAWIPGIAVDEAFRVEPDTPEVLRVKFEPR